MKINTHCTMGKVHWDLTIPCAGGDGGSEASSAQGAAGVFSENLDLYDEHPMDEHEGFLHPDALIVDRLEDGATVDIELGAAMALTPSGVPNLPRWAVIAFNVSDAHAHRRKAALAEEERIAEARRRNKREAERRAKAVQDARKALRMRDIMRSKLEDDKETAKAFNEDWESMTQNVSVERLCRSPAVQNSLRALLREHYLALSEVFKTYAASSSGVATAHELELVEFTSFLHDIEALAHLGRHTQDILSHIFEVATTRSSGVMGRAEFFVGNLHVAWLKYVDGGHGDSLLSRKVPRALVDPLVDQSMTVDIAVRYLHEDFIEPLMKKTMYGLVVSRAINSDEVLAMFGEHEDDLSRVFLAFASNLHPEETRKGSPVGSTMSLGDFGTLIEATGLMGGSDDPDVDDELTGREVRQAFAAAQGEADENGVSGAVGGNHQTRMDFPEFIEAMARVGCLKWEVADAPVSRKIGLVLEAVCAIKT